MNSGSWSSCVLNSGAWDMGFLWTGVPGAVFPEYWGWGLLGCSVSEVQGSWGIGAGVPANLALVFLELGPERLGLGVCGLGSPVLGAGVPGFRGVEVPVVGDREPGILGIE